MEKTTKMPYIIAEIGQAHDGSLGILYSYIDAVAAIGADAAKFQMHIAEAESSAEEPFRVLFSKEDKTRFDYWKRTGFSFEQWKAIKAYCEEKNLDFICSPFSNLAVDWLEMLDVETYKIGSGEVNNFLMLEKIAATGKPVILSSGMSSFDELDQAVAFLRQRDVDFSILQCTTAYPTAPEEYGLNVLPEMKERYGVKVGFSDHSGRMEACIAATALGAEILEFHIVFDRQMFGPDAKASLTIREASEMITGVKNIAVSLSSPVVKQDNGKFTELKKIFEKSLAVNKDLQEGHILSYDDLESKKPRNCGIPASQFENVIGRKLAVNKQCWDFLKPEDIL